VTAWLSPALVLIAGACLAALARGRLRAGLILLSPVAAGVALAALPLGTTVDLPLFGTTLSWLRIDPLARIFAWAFIGASFLAAIYGLYRRSIVEHCSALAYAGAAVGGVLAGDLITFLVFWELTTLFSAVLIWTGGGRDTYAASLRYLGFQVFSGLLLLAATVALAHQGAPLTFGTFDLGQPAAWAILAAFGIKAAFPVAHLWLPDAYPEASPFGTVVLSIFTTKLAIYALLRGFPGAEPLIPIGAAMIAFASFYAFAVPDLRRAMCYGLIAQLGIMVMGIGIGTPLSLNGAIAAAVASIFYQALVFMGLGAVLHRTGTARGAELGGLFRQMPWTALCTIVGCVAMAGLPLFSGFTTKTMVFEAAHAQGPLWAWFVLLFGASAAVLYAGLRVPLAVFFRPPAPGVPARPVGEAPLAMRIGMALAVVPCLLIGVWPALLHPLLPVSLDWRPYTFDTLLFDTALGAGAILAFLAGWRLRMLPDRQCPRLWEADWLVRRASPVMIALCAGPIGRGDRLVRVFCLARVDNFIVTLRRHHGPRGILARTWPTGSTVLWVTVILTASLILYAV
jgi:multicomponent Na+:H+ antiporter subunit D